MSTDPTRISNQHDRCPDEGVRSMAFSRDRPWNPINAPQNGGCMTIGPVQLIVVGFNYQNVPNLANLSSELSFAGRVPIVSERPASLCSLP